MSTPAAAPPPERSLGQMLAEVAARAEVTGQVIEKARRDMVAAARIITAAGEAHPDCEALRELVPMAGFNLSAVIAAGAYYADMRRELARQQEQADRAGILAILGVPPAQAPEPAADVPEPRRRAGHRAPRKALQPPLLRSVDGGKAAPLAAFAPVLGAAVNAVRHAAPWLVPAAGAAGTAATAVVIAGTAVSPAPAHAAAAGHRPHWTAPAAAPWTAAPIPSATVLTVPPPKGKHHRPESRPPAVTVPSPEPPPSPSSPPPPPSASPSRGVLAVQQQSVTIGPSRTAQIALYAQDGPVIWRASASDPRISLDVTHGGLAAGMTAVLTVTVDPAAMVMPGSATVTVGGQQVTVTWN